MARRSRALVDDTPAQLTIGGKTYLVSQMTLRAQFAIQRAAKEAVPPPVIHRPEANAFLESVQKGLEGLLEQYGSSVEGMSEKATQSHLLNLRAQAANLGRDALRDTLEAFVDWPGQVGTAEMSMAFANTEAGQRLIVKYALLPHQPGMTDEELEAVIDRMTMTQFERLVEVFMPPMRDEGSAAVPEGDPHLAGDGAGGTSTRSNGTSSTPPSLDITAGRSKPLTV